MSNSISNIAKSIATKLDSTDKDGRNGKIDKDKWNAFAQGKGNCIQRYIGVNTAAKSISVYINRESKKNGENAFGIGENWLEQLNGTPTSLVQLDEFIITAKKQNNTSNTPQEVEPPKLSEGLGLSVVSIPETSTIHVEVPEKIEAAAQTETHSHDVHASESDALTELQQIGDAYKSSNYFKNIEATSYEPLSIDKLETDSKLNEEVDKYTYYGLNIRYTLEELKKSGKFSNVSEELFNKIFESLYTIKEENISVASIIKTLKMRLFSDFEKKFQHNQNKIYRFIHDIATNFMDKYNGNTQTGTREAIVSTAQTYCDAGIKTRSEGNIYFSGGARRPWCADTVSTILMNSVANELPDDFMKTSSVSSLLAWGQKHKIYNNTSGLNYVARKNFIATKVKPGDIMIEKRNKSHTGIVIEVAEDGSWFKTIEGNTLKGMRVKTYGYDSKTLSGFISMDKYLADNQKAEDRAGT